MRGIKAIPYKIHPMLTDNGIHLTFPSRYADRPTATDVTHRFDVRCRENGIEHRFIKARHPWTNGQVERMNRIICKNWTTDPGRFRLNPHRQMSGPNS